MAKPKRWLVVPREKAIALRGVKTSRGTRKFHKKAGVFYLSDKAEAEEVESRYGMKGSRDVFVYEDEKYAHALNAGQWEMKRTAKGGDEVVTLHHYTFGASQTYSDAWEAFEKRRKDKKHAA